MPRDGWTTVSSFLRAEEAELLRGLLESAGLPVLVEDVAISALNPLLQSAVGGAKVLVPDADAAQAASIVSQSGLFTGTAPEGVEIPEEEWSAAAAPDAAGRRDPAPGPAGAALDPGERAERAAARALRASFVALALAGTLVVPLYALVAALRAFPAGAVPTRRARVGRVWALAVSALALALGVALWLWVFPEIRRMEAGGAPP